MNSCNFVGRLTADPELRRTNEGTAVCSYSLAVKRPMVADTTDFIEFVSWRQSAEYLAKYAHKGDIVAATGTLQPRTWTDKDGNKRKAFEVVTTNVVLVSSKKTDEGNNQPAQNKNDYKGPQEGYGQPQYNQQSFGGYQQSGYPAQSYQPPHPRSFAPIENDDPQLPF